ncbi:MAG: right-handed parallel beta-helix repeat-containing protein [Verrucomicrobia bacterium]|nr:MAG: right-handed parallel beta-helix repeat-containing protein [Verrucomicrobiota bacterium]
MGIALGWMARADFHVATDGNDAWAGTRARPFATLERARDAVRQSFADSFSTGEIHVWIHRGDYFRTNALELSKVDSGTALRPVLWSAFSGERVRLLGGKSIAGFVPVTDPGVLARLPEAARAQVLVADLAARGIAGLAGMQSRGFGRPTVAAHNELFHGGKPMTLARWPNEGEFARIDGFPEATGKGDGHGGTIGELPQGFLYAGDRPKGWKPSTDLWVHGYWSWDWANSYERVETLDTDRRRVKTATPHGLYGFRKGQRFQFLNVLEELDQPGEWYLDRGKGHLYFWPPEPRAAKGAAAPETLLSLLDQPFLRLRDVSHVAFRGLVLEASRANGIEIHGGASNRIEACVLRNLGNGGVVVDGGTGHAVSACEVLDTGDGGVSLTGGDRQTLVPGGHVVENCHFQRQGRWSKCYVPAIHLQGVGLVARHNLIHDHPHCGILFWGNDHLMEFNEIHHVALETGDVGAIYTGRDYSFRGNRIRNNFIHDTGGVGMGSMGVYMDDCVSGTEIEGNVFRKVHRAVFLGGGRDHKVANNVFVDCEPAIDLDGRGLDRSPVWRGMVDETMRKGLAAVPAVLYRERYPAMRDLDRHYGPPGGPALSGEAFAGVPPENNVAERNVCVGPWTHLGWNARPEHLKLDRNLAGIDPLFVDAARGDYRFRADSPAWKPGIVEIPFASIGLRSTPERRQAERLATGMATALPRRREEPPAP